MSNDNNEKKLQGGEGTASGEQSAPVRRKKVSVVFRQQNAQGLKDLPRGLKGAAYQTAVRREKEQAEKQGTETSQPKPQKKGPRPLPAGTKPVKPAVFGTDSKQEIKTADKEAAEKLAAAKPETKASAEAKTASEAQRTEEPAKTEASVNSALASVPEEAKKADAAREAEVKKPAAEEQKPAKEKAVKQDTEKTSKTADSAASKPVNSDVGKVPSATPQIRIVKSYADYDVASIIAKATAANKAKQAAEKKAQRSGDRRQRSGAQPQQSAGQSRQRDGQRPERGMGDSRRPDQRPGQSRGPAGRGSKDGQRASAPAFDTPNTKNTGSRNKNAHQRDRFDKRDKYRDDNVVQKTGKGAFIRPEPKKEKPEDDIKVIILPENLTIRDLADKLKLQPSVIIKKLFLEGKMVTPNTDLSYEEAEEIAMEYDILCEKEEKVDVIAELLKEAEEDEKDMVPRSPVVCVMGHVDHGKTSLLDAIRNTNVTSHEAGGITQHIGASVVRVGDRKITFLDTPGHEAFTAMRLRGAQATDIAVLVVAADDGVKPQTVEAINHAKSAEVEIVVAINKIDKPGADVDRVKQELTEYGLIAEEWGGSTTMVPVSAKTGEGIRDLLEMILLEADVLELKANPNRMARGIVIEAELDKGRGPVATVLVQKGTLRIGDNIAAGSCHGKVRAMIDDKGARVKKAGPSTPVEILGLNDVPNAGEVFMACNDEKEARNIADTFIAEQKKRMLEETRQKMNLDDLFDEIKAGNIKELPIIIKADVQGSVEAVKQSLGKLSNEEVAVKVIHSGVGNINESDVSLASAGNAIIIGFNVKPDPVAKSTAEHEHVDIRLYKVIYQAIDDLEAALTGMLAPVYEERDTGKAIVRQTFKASGVGTIAGCYVTDGVVERGSKARIYRGNDKIFDGNIASLKRFKDEVKEVRTGFECGMVFEDFSDIQVDDNIEIYKMVEVPRTQKKAD